MTDTPKYVSTAAVAAHFNVSQATVSMMVKNGDIPSGTYTRMGRVFRFDLSRVESALLEKAGDTDDQLSFDFNQDSAHTSEQHMENNDE
jgi:hypothetical protein